MVDTEGQPTGERAALKSKSKHYGGAQTNTPAKEKVTTQTQSGGTAAVESIAANQPNQVTSNLGNTEQTATAS